MSRHRSKTTTTLLIAFSMFLTVFSACSSKQEKARKAVEEKLQSQGVGIREMVVDFFHPADNMPDKAYIAVTITHNFASGEGNFQKEYLGYILKQDGPNWTVERNATYTKDKARAETVLAGGK
ncbi:MAG TPA: hypothetical protein VJ464_04895 [Blastocatellia bacterium]|nr:hypothetical protein [Blastocatellia bacterium]